ncbi:recombinase family protein [Streptomyces sp. G1]|uniref:recombinase family protein n=1 Tax=Streptomyces sp. G1 TaxID=361572 RepID=UPI00202F8B94|nr:recombinase family protein [Streptomyces sp. G1]MCM1967235.1 recombinase family protein [Streptomyces sp. G1]
MGQVRLLGALRESKGREWSDSFDGQENDVHGLVARHRGVLVETTRDRDVSGREVRLFDRPELGPWLKKPDLYDGIAVQKIDRLTRRPVDIYLFFEWCREHGKFLVSADGVDTRTRAGKAHAELLAMVGGWEWEAIQERNADSRARAREAGRWHGGTIPYGYRVNGSKGNWRLVPDTVPQLCTVEDRRTLSPVDVIHWMIEMFLYGPDGKEAWSYLRIAAWLDRHKVPTSTGKGQWNHRTVKNMLGSRANLLGEDTHGNVRAKALITVGVFRHVEKEMQRRSRSIKPPRANANPLAEVPWCPECGKKMHYLPQPDYADGRPHLGRYHCNTLNCPVKTVAAKELWTVLDAYMRLMASGVERHVREVTPGVDYRPEIADLKARIGRLRRQDEDGDWEDDRDGYRRRLGELRGKVRELEAHPFVPEGETWVPTGETYGDFWKRATLHEKGAELRRIGVKVYVDTRKPADDTPVGSGRLRLEAPSNWLRWSLLEKPKRMQKTD